MRILRWMLASLLLSLALILPCAAVTVSARSAVLCDADSGDVLFAKEADRLSEPASTTKLLTALCAVRALRGRTAVFTVSADAARTEGSSLYLRAGEEVSAEALLYGLLLESGNDAAVVLAEGLMGGADAFVAFMNETAGELGMNDSHFANPHGLPAEGHRSTAADLAKLMCACLREPELCRILSCKTYRFRDRTLTNHNRLLWTCEGCDGGKTGYTASAGRCLVSTALRAGRRLVCVTLNAPEDWKDHETLYALAEAGTECRFVSQRAMQMEIPVAGCDRRVLCTPLRGTRVTLPGYLTDRLATVFELPQMLYAECPKGTEIGSVSLVAGGRTVARLPLYTAEEVVLPARRGLLARLLDWLTGFFA